MTVALIKYSQTRRKLEECIASRLQNYCRLSNKLSFIHFAFFRNYSAYADLNFEDVSFDSNHLALDKIPCGAWDYDNSWYLNTISQKFDLVCDEAILNKVASSTFFAGTGVGVFIAGLLSDKIGRKKTILIFIALFFASGMTAAFANSYELWLTGRFLWGAASLGLRAVKTVMSLEMVGSKWRAIICVGLIEGGWTLGKDKIRELSPFLARIFRLPVTCGHCVRDSKCLLPSNCCCLRNSPLRSIPPFHPRISKVVAGNWQGGGV